MTELFAGLVGVCLGAIIMGLMAINSNYREPDPANRVYDRADRLRRQMFGDNPDDDPVTTVEVLEDLAALGLTLVDSLDAAYALKWVPAIEAVRAAPAIDDDRWVRDDSDLGEGVPPFTWDDLRARGWTDERIAQLEDDAISGSS